MDSTDIKALLPFIILAADIVVVMLGIAFVRSHRLTAALTLLGILLAAAFLPAASAVAPRQVTALIVVDSFALYYTGLILLAGFSVAALAYSYLEIHSGDREEFYLLLLAAMLGTGVLAASMHFASFFLGIEILSVSLYALAAYQRHNDRSIEAGVKYLILAAVSSAFILFGMALMYAQLGSMEFSQIAAHAATPEVHSLPFVAGLVLIISGLGFKLAVVPFHLWTPDVYEGAPAPVTAFIATVSKGAVFALVLRLFINVNLAASHSLLLIVSVIAVLSMFAGNILALLQNNVKRILAYSSISHIGYLLVTLVATGPVGASAASFYLAAYFVTSLGAFGVVSVLSQPDRDADSLEDYAGLAWRRPWLAAVFTAMLLSLAGIPLTGGFIAKFYVVAAGMGAALWLLVIVLVINSAIGLYYYLRIVGTVYSRIEERRMEVRPAFSAGAVLGGLSLVLVWLGVYPGPLLTFLQRMIQHMQR